MHHPVTEDYAAPQAATDSFPRRHLGLNERETSEMLEVLGLESLDALVEAAIPESIRIRQPLDIPGGRSEHEALEELRGLAGRNRVCRSYLGQGYSGCLTPPVIQRNILENPGWYTAYTPYQAEIAQGRLEALVNFQTMVTDLTGLPIANASLLDEATAAAEAMNMARHLCRKSAREYLARFGHVPPADHRRGANPRGTAGRHGDRRRRERNAAGRRSFRRAAAIARYRWACCTITRPDRSRRMRPARW